MKTDLLATILIVNQIAEQYNFEGNKAEYLVLQEVIHIMWLVYSHL